MTQQDWPSVAERLKEVARQANTSLVYSGYGLESADLRTALAKIAELEAEYHRRGVKIIELTEWAGAHLCRAEAAERERDGMRETLEPFAKAWSKLRDPLPQGPFTVVVDAMACCEAFRRLSTPIPEEPDHGE